MTDWMIKGPSFVNCNCDWGCPCQFNALPTHGFCQAISCLHIEEGHFGDVRLDGISWVGIFAWPGPIHEGNGECQAIVDERATPEQRAALMEILAGNHTDEGATIFQVFAATFSKVHEPLFMPIEFQVDMKSRTAKVRVPGVVEVAAQPIRNPVTGEEHHATIGQPNGFEYTVAEMGSGTSKTQGRAAVALDFKETYGQFSIYHMTNHGVVR